MYMKRKKGFTMIELMIAIVIVAVLASVVTPMMRGRIEKSKWSEAMAGCSSVSTAIRCWAAENSENGTAAVPTAVTDLGFSAADLAGKYFVSTDYAISAVGTAASPTYTVTVTPSQSNAPGGGSLVMTNGAFTLTLSGGGVSKF